MSFRNRRICELEVLTWVTSNRLLTLLLVNSDVINIHGHSFVKTWSSKSSKSAKCILGEELFAFPYLKFAQSIQPQAELSPKFITIDIGSRETSRGPILPFGPMAGPSMRKVS